MAKFYIPEMVTPRGRRCWKTITNVPSQVTFVGETQVVCTECDSGEEIDECCSACLGSSFVDKRRTSYG